MRKTHNFFLFKISFIGIHIGFCVVVQFMKSCRKLHFFYLHPLRLLRSQQHPQSGVLVTSFSTWRTENSLAEINVENTEVIKGCNIFWAKNWQTLSALWVGALSCNKKKSREQKSSLRIRRTAILGMFKDSAIILDAFLRSFLTKSAAAEICASVRVDFGRPPLPSFTSSHPSRNRYT
jgi:hypothetical protein